MPVEFLKKLYFCSVLSEKDMSSFESLYHETEMNVREDTEEKLKLVELTNTIIDKESKTELKKQINDWVREIDNSIKLLNGK